MLCYAFCVKRQGVLPHVSALVLRNEELVALLHVEGFVPSVDVGESSVYASLVGRVNVNLHQIVDNLWCSV